MSSDSCDTEKPILIIDDNVKRLKDELVCIAKNKPHLIPIIAPSSCYRVIRLYMDLNQRASEAIFYENGEAKKVSMHDLNSRINYDSICDLVIDNPPCPKTIIPIEIGHNGKQLPKHARNNNVNNINSNKNKKRKKRNKTK